MAKKEKEKKIPKSFAKHLDGVREHLEHDEEIIKYLYGMYDSTMLGEKTKRNGVMVGTDKRVIFYGKKTFGYNLETIDYSKISSVDYSKGYVFGKMKIYTSGNDIEFETAMEIEAKEFMQIIKEKQHEPKQQSTTIINEPSKSPAEQIKEYKELLDLDIISQEEFDAKKKELLGI